MSSGTHSPIRPSWDCSSCAEPWPCPPRQAKFLTDYEGHRQELRALMATFFIDAAEDLHGAVQELTELHTRFVGWALPARR